MARSEQAQVAAIIRKELKAHGIKARVTSEGYAGGNSVNVEVYNQAPWVMEKIEAFCGQFQEGHFNSMEDIYEYSNSDDSIPQVKFLFVKNEFDAEQKQAAYEYLLNGFGGYEGKPEKYEDAANEMGASAWVSQEVWQVLNGSMDRRSSGTQFWNKPRIKVAA